MYRRFLILTAVLLATLTLQAQNGSNNPFSQYGLGQSGLPTNTPFASAMGGVVYSRAGNNFINPFNPASYASIQSESFVFDISMNLQSTRISDADHSSSSFDGSLSALTVAFPILKFWKTSLGLLPYSLTSYETSKTLDVAGTGQQVKTLYDGTGNVSQFYWGNAFNILAGDETHPSLQAGFNLNLLYGTMSRAITYDFLGSDVSFYKDSRRQKDTRVRNLTFDLGLLYRYPLGEHYTLTAGLTCKLPQNLKVDDESLVYTYVARSTQEYTLDTIFPARGESSEYKSTLKQPFTLGLGLNLESAAHWNVALDLAYAPYSGMKYEEGIDNPIFGSSGLRYADNYRVALGGGWQGNPMATSYIERIGVTGGVHYERGKLSLTLQDGDWTLDEWGVGLGLTFPMRKGRSQLVLTGAYSSYGTLDLMRSEVLSIGLTLSSNERWFVKRKYN